MWPTQTTPYTGETCKFTGRKPLICWGRKNPMSYLSRMKNPDLPCPSVAAALRAYPYVLSSLDVRSPWEPLLPSLAYPKPGFTTSQLGLANCLLYACCVPYLDHPLCAISYIDHCHIHHASPPPRAIEGVRGIHL